MILNKHNEHDGIRGLKPGPRPTQPDGTRTEFQPGTGSKLH